MVVSGHSNVIVSITIHIAGLFYRIAEIRNSKIPELEDRCAAETRSAVMEIHHIQTVAGGPKQIIKAITIHIKTRKSKTVQIVSAQLCPEKLTCPP